MSCHITFVEPGQLLKHSGDARSIPTILSINGKTVLVTGRDFSPEEIERVEPFLNSKYRDTWLHLDKSCREVTPGAADDPMQVPTVYTSIGLKWELLYETEGFRKWKVDDEEQDGELDVAYIILVRGAAGSMRGKVRVLYSRAAVGIAMLEEVINGYSITFSAAIGRAAVEWMEPGTEYRKAKKVEDLYEATDDWYVRELIVDEVKVALLC